MSRTARVCLPFAASLSAALLLAACGSGSDTTAKTTPKPAETKPAADAAKPATKADAKTVANDAAIDAAASKNAAAAKPAAAPAAKPAQTAAKPADAKPADAAAAGVVATPATKAADGSAAATTAAKGDALAQVDAFIASKNIDKTKSTWKTSLPKPELASFDPAKSYFWDLKTNKGDMRFKFMPDVAPMHVTNAIYLTHLGFYDGLTFHRVLKEFMAQGGDPLGNGMGGPGYKLNLEVSPKVKHDKIGVLSTANSGPNTDGSQFFIMFKDAAMLDGKYSIYGQLVSGEDTLKKLEAAGADRDPMPPTEKLVIEKASISVE